MHKIVVIGASAGGVEALKALVHDLPADFNAAILIVMHMHPESPGLLPEILNRAGPLPVLAAVDNERILPQRIYCAIPDRHLLIEQESIRVRQVPRENRHRPSIDVLFGSAAQNYGKDVIGVLLTGELDDGVEGLRLIKSAGGTVIVQDPRDAMYPGLPRRALSRVQVDFVAPLKDIPPILVAQIASRSKTNA